MNQELFDCDIHHWTPTKEEWAQYLTEPYKSEVGQHGPRRMFPGTRSEDGGNRWDVSALTAQDVVRDHMNPLNVRRGILTGVYGPTASSLDVDYAAAMCRAYNDYTLDKWLSVDDRFLAGIMVPTQDPIQAAEEIERLAGHPQLCCVRIAGGSERIPFGQRFYWPLWEAAARHNLPVHVHPSTGTVNNNCATSAAGNVTTYLQSHVCLPQFYQANLISLVLEGVFEKFPTLRFLFVEGGFGWLPHVLWRMDKEYKGLRQQAPLLKRLPSQYVRDHVRITTQPMEEPEKPEHMSQLIDMMGGPEMLFYASDYPHFDFDPPSVLPRSLGEDTIRKILHDNASAFFEK